MTTDNFIQLYDQNGNAVYPITSLDGLDSESKSKINQIDASIRELYEMIAAIKK